MPLCPSLLPSVSAPLSLFNQACLCLQHHQSHCLSDPLCFPSVSTPLYPLYLSLPLSHLCLSIPLYSCLPLSQASPVCHCPSFFFYSYLLCPSIPLYSNLSLPFYPLYLQTFSSLPLSHLCPSIPLYSSLPLFQVCHCPSLLHASVSAPLGLFTPICLCPSIPLYSNFINLSIPLYSNFLNPSIPLYSNFLNLSIPLL